MVHPVLEQARVEDTPCPYLSRAPARRLGAALAGGVGAVGRVGGRRLLEHAWKCGGRRGDADEERAIGQPAAIDAALREALGAEELVKRELAHGRQAVHVREGDRLGRVARACAPTTVRRARSCFGEHTIRTTSLSP
ncbi:uncharacterized protein PHACADRAFT_32021 [Phanerochaete carnosa HHB-10118-sp]|uniref:Uncharacterized protein n=1 Tax=Phanerochaete carnosa (strain HHB-10118-sp) TaxID=650164 RepID=K5WL19_PHACS|nr:uncharacterized protein PHACADRAFT_32021 [Phanerochaete carnosa HHB-10118-sp]EKM50967.1 hypothetical protein PHACADRAFT_32021 [Phanerochaete carnosa HHB-10118-sp]